jgi:two-component system, OmpR family, KDP operon response regulator KdpE
MIETTATLIMIVSEGVRIPREVHTLLTRNGYPVVEARCGEDALLKLREGRPNLILLDLDTAAGRWLDVCREIRSEATAPILMLSARNTERDKVIALDSGVDDYIVKPYGVQELLARVRAALRRANSTGKPEMPYTFESGDLKIDFDRRTVVVRGKKVRLTPKEWEVLQLLVTNQGKPIRHQMMLRSIWGPAYGRETQYLRVFIRQLRRKLESNPSEPELICTEPWLGYRFEMPTAEQPVKTIEINATG